MKQEDSQRLVEIVSEGTMQEECTGALIVTFGKNQILDIEMSTITLDEFYIFCKSSCLSIEEHSKGTLPF